MKGSSILVIITILFILSCGEKKDKKNLEELSSVANYLQNRAPLVEKPYLELPLGTIKPKGWLEDQLKRMAKGMTGHLDELYPEVVGQRNGWLGGDGDGWERGPYWIDGLLPLAYILDDENLRAKVKPWIEWTLNNQNENGYLGPIPFEEEPTPEQGIQKGMRRDWWPKMVMLKILRQHYNATKDERVITALTNYFKYQLKELPNRPLDDLSFWANRRGADNLQVVYWLYNITGDEFLLDLGEIIQEQTFPWKTIFTNTNVPETDETAAFEYFKMKTYPFDSAEIMGTGVSQIGTIHTVNLAQGLKAPAIYYQKNQDIAYIESIKKALNDIKKYHGQPQGMFGGDEPLAGTSPVRGIEFCSISEEMFSLESIIQITGDMEFADLLERIAFNALPAQATDDYGARQYFQAANQVQLTDGIKTSFQTVEHHGTDFVFGLITGYPCCTTNMHQSWPKFVQNLFYATADGGIAALMYAPSEVTMKVADNIDLKITETTGFPFRETVDFKLQLSESTSFPFHFRIPSWAKDASVLVNGEAVTINITDGLVIINRQWNDNDEIELKLPMETKTTKWHKGSTAIERGPLVYALKIEAEERPKDRNDRYGEFIEVFPKEDWNYGLIKSDFQDVSKAVKVEEMPWDGKYPWNIDNSPVQLKIRGVKIPEWKLVDSAPLFPDFPQEYHYDSKENPIEEITLIPYGCTTLRITEFPTYDFSH